MLSNSQQVFFELVRAGLLEKEARLSQYGIIDYNVLLQLATEQSVLGLVTAGLERVVDVKVPHEWALQFVGQTLQIEQRNKAMNGFVAELIDKLRKVGVYALLVKGQGIAQCYEKPLWRASGDVDLLLSDTNYEKAKELLVPLASDVETEYTHFKHLGMTIDGWVVELHGTLHSRLSARVDKVVDEVQGEVFYGGKVRSVEFKSSSSSRVDLWSSSDATRHNPSEHGSALAAHSVQVFLPAPDEDVVFVFTHILHHFFFEGIGLRQICDWCRLLWTYRTSLDVGLLENRLRKAGLMSEWKAFAAFAVKYLGMPVEAMPLYDSSNVQKVQKFYKKADRICKFVMEVGNFGHNSRRDYSGMSYAKRKFVSAWGRLSDMLRHFRIFPLDSIRFLGGVLRSGLHAAVRGE